MLIAKLEKAGVIHSPQWLSSNVHYLTMMGSTAYGVTHDTSDVDLYGFCIPKKEMVFPHLTGEIQGFGRQIKRFEQWQEHHINDPDKDKVYDFTIFNIVKYFDLLMNNNPNAIDSIFVPHTCILHITQVGNMVRDNRRIFLHKGCFHKFKGYAYSQMHKMKSKEPTGKRKESVDKFGYDVKYAYHLIRLLQEAEQILENCDLDLQQNNEQLKAVRRGEMNEEDIIAWASEKELYLEKLYEKSALPYGPDEDRIKQLLLDCLEQHYGKMQNCVVLPDKSMQTLKQIKELLRDI